MVMKFGDCGHPLRPFDGIDERCIVCWLLSMGRVEARDWGRGIHHDDHKADDACHFPERRRAEKASTPADNVYHFPFVDEDPQHVPGTGVFVDNDESAKLVERMLRFRSRHAIDMDSSWAMEHRRPLVDFLITQGYMRLCENEMRAEWVRIPWEHLDRSYIPPTVVEASPNRVRTNVRPFSGMHAGRNYVQGHDVTDWKRNEPRHYSMSGHPVDD